MSTIERSGPLQGRRSSVDAAAGPWLTTVEAGGSGMDRWAAAGAALFLGSGALLAFGGAQASSIPWLVTGAFLALCGLLVLMSGGWLGTVVVVAVSLPLPAVYSSDSLRLAPVLLVTLAVVFAWSLARGLAGEPLRSGRAPLWALGLLLTAGVVSAAFAANPFAATRELISLSVVCGFFFVATDEFARRPAARRTVMRALALAAALTGILAVVEMTGLFPGRYPLANSGLYRAAGGFEWPNELAIFLAVSLPFAVHSALHEESAFIRIAGRVAVACVAAGLLATFSRGSWIATAIAPAALVVSGRTKLATTFWVLLIAGAAVADFVSGGAISSRVAATVSDPLVGQRFALTQAGLLMFFDHPFVGVGPGNFGPSLDQYGLLVSGLWDYVGSAHNSFVHIAAEGGIFALAGLASFLGLTLRQAVRAARQSRGNAAEHATRTTLAWAFTALCLIAFAEWTLAQGIGQLLALVAALVWADTWTAQGEWADGTRA